MDAVDLGVNLFVASGLSKISIEAVSKAALRFVFVLLAFTLLLILVPWLTTVGYKWG